MEIKIDGININYEINGEGKEIFLLNGWGTEINTYRSIINFFSQKNRIISFDMPGFGKSDPPKEPWGIEEHSELVSKFIKQVSISKDGEKPVLMGHSFGGKLIIYMVANKMVEAEKLILFGSAGIKPKRKPDYYIKVYSYKLMKKLAQTNIFQGKLKKIAEEYKNKAGSADYKILSGVMRQTFVKVVNQHVKDLLHKIDLPTLLIWGENDTATPLTDGKLMEKLIPDAGLVILKNAGHYAFLEKYHEFCRVCDYFINKSS